MAITYIGGLTGGATDGGAISINLTSLNLQQGDIVLAIYSSAFYSDTNVSITGYTEISDLYYHSEASQGNINGYVGYKIMGATPDTTLAIGAYGDINTGNALIAYVWRGVDTTTPLDVTPTTAIAPNPDSGSRPNNPSITPATAGAVVIAALGFGRSDSTPSTYTDPDGYENLVTKGQSDNSKCSASVASKFWSGSGAEDPGEWTFNYYTWAATTIALRPLLVDTFSPQLMMCS